MQGIRKLKRDIKLCGYALKGLRDAEPHLTKEGVYDYDKVPQNVRAAAETLINGYMELCKDIVDAYHKVEKRKGRYGRKDEEIGKASEISTGSAAGKTAGRPQSVDGNPINTR